jgi:GTP-binding protein Era
MLPKSSIPTQDFGSSFSDKEFMNPDFKCGYVIITGKPNVGKSTLLNKLIGENLSIISAKPQTTRLNVTGIYNDNKKQIIFLDTPGFLNPRYELQSRMMKQLYDTVKDADVLLFITDRTDFPSDYDYELITMLKKIKRPRIALVNKTDLKGKNTLSEISERLKEDFEEVLLISAIQGDNLDKIIPLITNFLPYGPPFFDRDQLSDLPMRFFAQEIIREGIFNNFEQEIPYSTAVVIDKYEETPGKVIINATIWIERDSQKPIIIGTSGQGLRIIREYAERKCSEFNQMPTEVHLWVKVKRNWRKNPLNLKELGFRY